MPFDALEGVGARLIGKYCEHRAINALNKGGFNAKLVLMVPILDYAFKTDLIVRDKRHNWKWLAPWEQNRKFKVQVSRNPKSKRQQEKLFNRGVIPIAAGNNYSYDDIVW